MEEAKIKALVEKQREYFLTGATLPVKARIQALYKLRNAMEKYSEKVQRALMKDLKKCELEGFMTETGLAMSEMSYVLKHIKKWSRDKAVRTPLSQFASHSFIRPMPYGVTLVMSPWNYPYLLTVEPVIDAIAAGNTVIVKPSAYSPNVCEVMKEMFESALPQELCAVVTGGRSENTALLEQRFDYIFFTGSQAVGKEVLSKAALNLTPVTLELGGKSPVVIDKSAKLALAARRIVFGKYLNCGQTCVAPDYVLCEKSVKDEFVKCVISEIKRQIGEKPFENSEYGKMINEKHFSRVCSLIDSKKVVYGGKANSETLQIAPTVMDNVTFDDEVMKQEIFGPVLPIITVDRAEDAINIINQGQRPLALYVFSCDKSLSRKITTQCAFGGGCINDTIIHLATSNMGFGGMGESGMGSYHGKTGFDTFTHYKSIVDKKNFIDLNMRYRPYTSFGSKLIHMFLK